MKKNGGQNRNNRSATARATTDIKRNTDTNGGGVRTDDESVRVESNGNDGSESITDTNAINAERSISGNSELTITDGFYFTPRGTVERIPNGHYIGSDGRLRKRRQQRSATSDAANGDTYRNRSETSEQTESFAEDYLRDVPLNVRGKRKRKTVKEETSKLTLVTMLSTACVAVFSSVELLTKHQHWALEKTEAQILAEGLNDALATLPAKYYDSIVGIVEKYIPWINLIFIIGAIVIPRIEASGKRIEERNNQPNNAGNERNAGTEDNPFSNWSSLGWNK